MEPSTAYEDVERLVGTLARQAKEQSIPVTGTLQRSRLSLPGFATPRIVCDVPFVGKRWVHQIADYDTERGISYWTKNYRTAIEVDDDLALSREYPYYDPIYMLPEAGQAWWRTQRSQPRASSAEVVSLANATG